MEIEKQILVIPILIACWAAATMNVEGVTDSPEEDDPFTCSLLESKYKEGVQCYNAGGLENTQRAFEKLYDAWEIKTVNQQLKKKIEKILRNAYDQYCDEVAKHVYLPNDTPNPSDESFYDCLISYAGNARACRLKGILLLNRGEYAEALSLFHRADQEGDTEASYFIALCHAEGRGIEQNPDGAFQWLMRGTSLGSPRANFEMARILWNCDFLWGAPNTSTEEAADYLERVCRYAESWTLGDPREEQNRKGRVDQMRNAINTYLIPWGGNPQAMSQAAGLRDFEPTLEVLLLDLYYEKSLRWVYFDILPYISMRPPGSDVDVDKIKFVVSSSHPTSLGRTTRLYPTKDTVANTVEIFLDNLPPEGETTQQYWWRRLVYLNTLVHEMGHVFFSQRYKVIPECGSNLNCLRTYEGHATNVAYLFINNNFFRNRLSPEEYAELFLSNEYKQYFFWFRNECMSPGDDVYWNKIDHWEREAAQELGLKNYKVITRQQVFPILPLH